IRDAEKVDLAAFKKDLSSEVAGLTMDYFFKAINADNMNPDPPYTCTTVPQGGGRRELGLVAEYNANKCRASLDTFRETQLETCIQRLRELKIAAGINPDTTVDEHTAFNLAMSGMESPNQALRRPVDEQSRLVLQVKEAVRHVAQEGVATGESAVDLALKNIDKILGANVTGLLKVKSTGVLKSLGIEAAAKQTERGRFRAAARALRQFEGNISRVSGSLASGITEKLRDLNPDSLHSLSAVEKMLNLIMKDKFSPTVATAEIGWTFGEVFDPEVYPEKNYLRIPMSAAGDLDPEALEKQLERKEEELKAFPELFELYRSNIILIVNDPHNPTGRVLSYQTKLRLLQVASKFNLTILSDEAYRCQVDKKIKDEQGYPSLSEFYEEHRSFFPNPLTIHTSLSTTKWGMRAGGRTGVLVSNDSSMAEFVEGSIDSVNTMALYLDRATLLTGLEVKSVCAKLEKATLYADAVEVIDEVLESLAAKKSKSSFCAKVYFELIEARNDLDRLKKRNATRHDYRKFISKVISKLKGFRLEKQTQKDAAKRSQAAIDAVKRVAGITDEKDERPIYQQYLDGVAESIGKSGLATIVNRLRGKELPEAHPEAGPTQTVYDRFLEPQGPFYFCIKLDENGGNPALQPFLERIAKARKIDVVPQANGYVRFALGGFADGTDKGYELLSLAIETDLRLLLDYWEKVKGRIKELEKAKDVDPVETALKEIFPGGEVEFVRTFQEKAPVVEALTDYYLIKNLPGGKKEFEKNFKGKPLGVKTAAAAKLKGKTPGTVRPLVHSLAGKQNLSEYFHKIEPDSPGTIVIIRLDDATCRTTEDFIKSPQFQDLFNHYLLEVGRSIQALSEMSDGQILEKFGAHIFPDLFRTRNYSGINRALLDEVMVKVMNTWFSDATIKVLAVSSESKHSPLDVYTAIQRHITHFIEAFTTEEAAAKINIKPTFQVGYEEVLNVKPDENLPDWAQGIIEKSPFAGETVATDEAPEIVTGGAARVAKFERGIYRRDGDGVEAPKAEYFRKRLTEFKESYNPKEYICKMVQIGPTRMMMVIHASYEHYMAEELRLFPQFDCSLDDFSKLRPDTISFLGLPHKVMGDDYRIGYYMDQCKDGRELPVSWVDRENITDYMGYLKKPVLTNSNEAVKALGGLPVHGGAMRINFKKGPSKSGCELGDSGTGKSEEYIAMAEKIIASGGGWENVESIELIAGDMLSLWRGADGDVYMLGTESGDFMRMTDIGEDWQNNLRDLIAQSSKTNKDHPTNPRTTVPGLCRPNVFLKPVRLNFAFLFDNFNIPPGSSFQEEESARNLMTVEYPKGYRREKGTSGDQPNLKASILFSKNPRREVLIDRYGEEALKEFDELLGWELVLAASGKVQNGILRFKDVPNQIFRANALVAEMFRGQHVTLGDKTYEIRDTGVSVENACYNIILVDENGARKEFPLDRNIFDQLYPPVASTYCGNPFISPQGMGERLSWIADAMDEAGVITGTVYTQLAVPGRQFSGPAKAADDHRTMLQRDKRVNARFQRQKEKVISALTTKYGHDLLGEGDVPERLMFYNVRQYEEQQSESVHIVDKEGNTIPLKTPHFVNRKPDIDSATGESKAFEFKPSLIVPEVAAAIKQICRTERLDLDIETDLDRYRGLVADSKEELIYQILIKKGQFGIRYPAGNLYKIRTQVKVAEEIANRIWGEQDEEEAA
ncbi:aminotransferase class I/II-fold pyridoxal phosphate-dependent enzyme, partial [Candidatus Peregrinibacteria bacterium]|nr:aminotransferase class I/II-fold pyridoxal phosphate-dependent enzyme [Candidatus Peregrinibacteria bacterium]